MIKKLKKKKKKTSIILFILSRLNYDSFKYFFNLELF